MPNSVGKTDSQVRRFLRENGIPPNLRNVELIGREIRRTQSENETVERVHREMERTHGIPATCDAKGDVSKRVKAMVKRKIAQRGR